MSRKLTIFALFALIAVLAACSSQGSGETTDPSTDALPSAAASASAGASDDSSEGAGGTASVAVSEAFAALGDQDVSSLSDMADLDEVEATIRDCESIADWSAGAAEIIGEEVNPSTAQLLLEIRCELPALDDTAVCEEVASS